MKLYFPRDHYDKKYRRHVLPFLKPFIKNESYTDAERQRLYGISDKDYNFTLNLEDADLVLLTMSWNYYLSTNQTTKAIELINKSQNLGKKVVVFNASDFGVKTPYFSNCIIVRRGGYQSQFKNEQGMPSFIDDPLQKHFNTTQVLLREYKETPEIGFCGQANPSLNNAFKEMLYTVSRNLQYYVGLKKEEPQQIISTSYLRANVLRILQNSEGIKTNFILRKQYRAGVTSNKDAHATTLEFYNNIQNSDYIVCARGAGNFSVRFYETLAMGRIPVFINTDSPLPFFDSLDWKNHIVWIKSNELDKIAEKISHFHEKLGKDGFENIQMANRRLWEEKLSLNGFFNETFSNAIGLE